MFHRGDRSRATVAKCSALGMEIKRKKIRESAIFPSQEDGCIQEKLGFEIRMQEGVRKLLSVSTQKDQILHGVKNLMTCSARIQEYTVQLHSPQEASSARYSGRRSSDAGLSERLACPGKLFIKGIRIPLMWKDTEHFGSKEKSDRYAVFCMLRLGHEIFDTDMVIVDKTTTDICFENTIVLGAKYNRLAHITLLLDSVEDSFRTHTLTSTAHEDSSFWLPLYGNLCCHLVAQPTCMTDDVITGFLNQQETAGGIRSWIRMYCVLKGGNLHCYYTPEEIEAKLEATMTIPINKETRIRAVEKDSKKRTNSFTIINLVSGEAVTKIFSTDSKEELQKWMEAFWQHFYNLSQWKHCAEELMRIEITSPRKPPLFLTKEATSVYHDMSIGSPVKFEGLTDILHRKIEETDGQFLLGLEESVLPPWSALFDGNHQLHVEKNALSPTSKSTESNLLDGKGKKRRAPPPPPNKTPYGADHKVPDPTEKENIWPRSSFSRKSLDAKLSSFMQQFQRPIVPPRKPMSSEGNDPIERDAEVLPSKPVPAPRQKSLKDRLVPKSWLQSQE
ncbi:rhotekin-2 isoform X1 [Ranitomeya imitator]|uniref:rhotekin-2 isoform X1 n=1 Tax=Ranitomeya imitator TaxID=111125 RepID=UPI0037E876E7